MVKTLEEKVEDNNPFHGEEGVFILFDTCAFINLYYRYGLDFLSEETIGNGNCCVITSAVKRELEHQYETRACLSDDQCLIYNIPLRSKKVPFQLMTAIWQKLGEGKLLEEDVYVSEEKYLSVQEAGRLGSPKRNYRTSPADVSLVCLAEHLQQEKTLIVSNDSDIPNTLSAIHLKQVYHITETEFGSQYRYKKAA